MIIIKALISIWNALIYLNIYKVSREIEPFLNFLDVYF